MEKNYKNGKIDAFRTGCQIVSLKSEKRTPLEVADFLGCCELVNNWLARYEKEGLEGLKTREGRGIWSIKKRAERDHTASEFS